MGPARRLFDREVNDTRRSLWTRAGSGNQGAYRTAHGVARGSGMASRSLREVATRVWPPTEPGVRLAESQRLGMAIAAMVLALVVALCAVGP